MTLKPLYAAYLFIVACFNCYVNHFAAFFYNFFTVQPCKFSITYAGESLFSPAYVIENLFGALPKRDVA